ncbi:MAG: hypothetical protein DKM50_08515 [Candidatus Margulisiibacteriota bacterium]|nr:MAG: hypothetical protein A2X43_11930 [Candidatus Margulisbacteria bacterium GWD2_39_127]OGI10170.1 MAG: hypothetical protein A2X41_01175 [Candidatus Margulisbacteria bacterium GWE2_39_32]PZM79493.1 MAG: hypothetical protein DKM50_08515 [Candidatus Margulisiibacteriota bacterium]HAR63836.1 hypothetical protein [Candidatus Margulisiibacteriota bacterium]HCT83631.1 hypothetical protein [Candidatus Margulisiibacteriota bacterium]
MNTAPENKFPVIIYIIPLLIGFRVSLVGELYISGLFLSLYLIYMFPKRNRLSFKKFPFQLLMLCILWLLSLVVTDIARETPFGDYARGWAKVSMFFSSLCALYLLLYDRRKQLTLFAIVLVAGLILEFFLFPTEYNRFQVWKFGFGLPVTLLCVTLCQHSYVKKVRWSGPLILLALSFVHLIEGYRSLGLIVFFTGLYLFIQIVVHNRGISTFSWKKAGMVVVIVLLFLNLFKVLYGYALDHSVTNYDLKAKTLAQQGRGGLAAMILGGRKEIYPAMMAIKDSPIIGHGSWAKDKGMKYRKLWVNLRRQGYDINDYGIYKDNLIPSHSHITGAWVEAGFLGALFWFTVIVLIIKVLFGMYFTNEPLSPLAAFISFSFLWDILFSPFGANVQIIDAYYIVVLLTVYMTMEKKSFSSQSQNVFLLEKTIRNETLKGGVIYS